MENQSQEKIKSHEKRESQEVHMGVPFFFKDDSIGGIDPSNMPGTFRNNTLGYGI